MSDVLPWNIETAALPVPGLLSSSNGPASPLSGPQFGPLLQHPAPLPDGQARPRPPPAIGSEQRASLVEAVAGEQQALDVPAVSAPQLDLKKLRPRRPGGRRSPPGRDRSRSGSLLNLRAEMARFSARSATGRSPRPSAPRSSSARKRDIDLRRTGRTCQRTKEGSP